MSVLVGTERGLLTLDGGAARLRDQPITAVSGGWVLVGGHRLAALDASVETELDGPRAWCLLDTGDRLYVGTAEARLFAGPNGTADLSPVDSFDRISTRDQWYTPWGAPPDTRSLAATSAGTLLANVHVGGVWRDNGVGWDEVIGVDHDTHQVSATGDTVVAAAAVGLGRSVDGGRTWDWTADGLHASYCRAAAITGDAVLVTASSGPGSRHGAIYRRPLDGDGPLVKCDAGLPEWFPFNLDTGQLVATPDEAVLGTADGRVYRSTDGGATWEQIADGLPPVRTIAIS